MANMFAQQAIYYDPNKHFLVTVLNTTRYNNGEVLLEFAR